MSAVMPDHIYTVQCSKSIPPAPWFVFDHAPGQPPRTVCVCDRQDDAVAIALALGGQPPERLAEPDVTGAPV